MHIIQGLGCDGIQITKAYWTILHDYGLFHTAEEEEMNRFKAAPPSSFPTSPSRLPSVISFNGVCGYARGPTLCSSGFFKPGHFTCSHTSWRTTVCSLSTTGGSL